MLNKVQKAAFDLIQSDARFIYTLVDMQNNAKNINSNFLIRVFHEFSPPCYFWPQTKSLRTPQSSNNKEIIAVYQ